MTWALCLNCGEVKFGAICPCPKCEISSTGDMQLDIAFSDHHIDKQTLHDLGNVVTTIHQVSGDEQLCFWAFIRYISQNHPSILGVNLEPEVAQKCDEILQQTRLPEVTLRPSSHRHRPGTGPPGSGKQWWQFWR